MEYFKHENPTKVEICNRYNISKPTATRWIAKSGANYINTTCKIEQPSKEKLIKIYMNGKPTTNEIATFFGVSVSLILNWLREYDIPVHKVSHQKSKSEIEICDFLNANGGNFVSRKSILEDRRLELDGYDADRKLAFEYCGLYWHSTRHMDHERARKIHVRKFELCEKVGIRLMTIFEDEWLSKRDIVQRMLLHALGKNEKVYARKCKIDRIDSSTFLDANHIQGNVRSTHHFGLIHENCLVAAITLGKSRFDKNIEWEVLRYATSKAVVGGFGKLFNAFIKEYNPTSVVSYCDLRYGNGGGIYEKNGFMKISRSSPNYFYVGSDGIRHSRIQFQKHKLANILVSFDSVMTETENMENNGYGRIWDCGNDKWV